MLNKIKHYLSVGLFTAKLNIQSQMEYPAFLIGWFISNVFQFLTGIASIRFVVNTFQDINGWTFKEIAFMYGIGILSHALSIILFIQTWYLESLVVHGEFDRMKLRPLNVFFQFIVLDLNLIGLTDMLPGIIIFIYGSVSIHFRWTFENTVRLLLVIIGATLIRGSLYAISASVAFWTKRSGDFVGIYLDLFSRVFSYPLSVFGEVLQGIFTFLLPLGFVCFYPAAEFLDKDMGYVFPFPASVITFVAGLAMFMLTFLVFDRGIKAYESAGN